MKYLDFINIYKEPIFNLQDLKIAGAEISTVQLSQWTRSGYLLKLKNGVYVFEERKGQLGMEAISNYLYEPSYISLERALSKHSLIPEIIYNCTAVTTRKTATITNAFGSFIYRSIRSDLFFGYEKVGGSNGVYFLAEPEKALLDYLYLNSSKINNRHDITELRLNETVLEELDQEKITGYLKIFNSKKLERACASIFGK